MPQSVLKIGIVGPESTGKSTLGQQLAQFFRARYVPEYAREYVGHLGRPYTYEDVCLIAEHNRGEAAEAMSLSENSCVCGISGTSGSSALCFFDTELIITKVWLDEVYHRRPDWLTEPIPADCQMDFYLLLSPDIAAESDPLRENLDQPARERLFDLYLREVRATGKPYGIVSGQNEKRTALAIRLIEEAFPKLNEPQ